LLDENDQRLTDNVSNCLYGALSIWYVLAADHNTISLTLWIQ